jgi:CRISPR system Cascade subunit CasB
VSDRRANPKDEAADLLAYLRRLKSDRGAMADLRRALSPAQRHRAWPLLAPVSGIDNPRVETLAGLFAYHPEEAHQGNLGTTCRRLTGENNTFEARFQRLLACGRDEICDRLPAVILAARAKGVEVNYEQLFVDLTYWSDRVKARWAQEFWGSPSPDETSESLRPEDAS